MKTVKDKQILMAAVVVGAVSNVVETAGVGDVAVVSANAGSWRFSTAKEQDGALLKGGFRPHHPEMQYPWIESWSDAERILAAYVENQVLPVPSDGRTVYALNASQEPSLVLELAEAPASAEAFDTFGRSVGRRTLTKGLQRVDVPLSGYLCLSPRKE